MENRENSSMMSFNEQLIEEVKKYPFLFNKKERDYKNVLKKNRIWHEIGIKLHLTDEEVSKKWKSLRDRFTRELKKYSEISASGSQSQQLEIQYWELFDAMQFLKDHCEPNKKTVTIYKASNLPRIEERSSSNAEMLVFDETVDDETRVASPSSSCSTLHQTTNVKKTHKRRVGRHQYSFYDSCGFF